MDEFAQTRGADDLFEDDFTPLEDPPTQQHQYPDSETHQAFPPREPPPTSQPPPRDNAPNKSHNSAPPQPHQSPSTSPSTTAPEPSLIDPSSSAQPAAAAAAAIPRHDTIASTTTTSPPPPPPSNPTPQQQQQQPPTPVRGPRHLSGGPTLTRLSETELSAKLAAARLNSSRRAEAHARAEADEASFLQREARAGERRREEGRNWRVMDQERERNRLRKLESGRRGGREWDEGKVEEEVVEGRGRGGFRGVNGGVSGGRRGRGGQLFGDGEGDGYGYDGGRGFEGRGGRGRGRGRGGRGGGEGRGGRGRGGFQSGQAAEQRVPDPQTDFPALPSASKVNGQQQTVPPDTVKESVLEANKTERPSWDDQVAESGGGW